jgi:CBS domain containing-hemolysin-like protein
MDYLWLAKMAALTFVLSIMFATTAGVVMRKINIFFSVLLLLLIIIVGIVFDIIGVATTTADTVPFHSMASRKIKEAKNAIELINSKEKVANFCNDVIGDTCGIISGYGCTSLIFQILLKNKRKDSNEFKNLLDILITGLVAAITVGGRSIGKNYAISNCNNIVFYVAKVLYFFKLNKNKRRVKKVK